MMNIDSDVFISYSIPLPNHILDDFREPLEDAGVGVHLDDRGPAFHAGIEWLLPTAVVILLSQKYVEGILQEAGKDHYLLTKGVLSKLLRRLVGKEREIQIQYLPSSPGKLSKDQPGALSVYVQTRADQLVKFVFEDQLAPVQHEQCLDAIFGLLRDHNSHFPNDTLTRSIVEANLASSRSLVMRFLPNEEKWYLWSPRIRLPEE